ncbi:MAG: hypothetical protein Q4E06_06055 [Lautropia sp.]|nr:hypothetical protein [Lautropia sp.]
MSIVNKLGAAGLCLGLGAGVLFPSSTWAAERLQPARAGAPVADTAKAVKQAARQAPDTGPGKGALLDEAAVRTLLSQGADPAVSLQSIHQHQGRYVLHMAYEAKQLPDPAPYIAAVARALLGQAQVLARHGVPVENLWLKAYVPEIVYDAQGKASVGRGRQQVLSLIVYRQDYDNANWAQLTPPVLLDLAEVSFSPAGRLAARLYCRQQAGADAAQLFCAAVASGRKKAAMSAMFAGMAKP